MASGDPIIFDRVRLTVYALVALLLGVSAIFIVRDNARYSAQLAKYQLQLGQQAAARAAERSANSAAYSNVTDVFEAAKSEAKRPLTRADAERLLNNGQPLARRDGIWTITDAKSGGQVHLNISNEGRWHSTSGVRTTSPRAYPYPPDSRYDVISILRRMAYFCGYLACAVLLLILVTGWRRARRHQRIADSADLLFLAIVSFTLASLSPRYLGVWNVFVHDDSGGWGVIAIACASFMLFLASRTPTPHGPRLCVSCKYDLTGNVSGVCPECGTPASATG